MQVEISRVLRATTVPLGWGLGRLGASYTDDAELHGPPCRLDFASLQTMPGSIVTHSSIV